MLALLAALRAKVMGWMNCPPGVALSESGNLGLSRIHAVEKGEHTPLACGLPRLAANFDLQTSLTK